MINLLIYWLSVAALIVGIALLVALVSWVKTFVDRGNEGD
jgi:hypothetical protein